MTTPLVSSNVLLVRGWQRTHPYDSNPPSENPCPRWYNPFFAFQRRLDHQEGLKAWLCLALERCLPSFQSLLQSNQILFNRDLPPFSRYPTGPFFTWLLSLLLLVERDQADPKMGFFTAKRSTCCLATAMGGLCEVARSTSLLSPMENLVKWRFRAEFSLNIFILYNLQNGIQVVFSRFSVDSTALDGARDAKYPSQINTKQGFNETVLPQLSASTIIIRCQKSRLKCGLGLSLENFPEVSKGKTLEPRRHQKSRYLWVFPEFTE